MASDYRERICLVRGVQWRSNSETWFVSLLPLIGFQSQQRRVQGLITTFCRPDTAPKHAACWKTFAAAVSLTPVRQSDPGQDYIWGCNSRQKWDSHNKSIYKLSAKSIKCARAMVTWH